MPIIWQILLWHHQAVQPINEQPACLQHLLRTTVPKGWSDVRNLPSINIMTWQHPKLSPQNYMNYNESMFFFLQRFQACINEFCTSSNVLNWIHKGRYFNIGNNRRVKWKPWVFLLSVFCIDYHFTWYVSKIELVQI